MNNVIVTMTSWLKRINNVETVIISLLNNNVKPDKIYCYLSSDEFNGYELPESLLNLEKNNIEFEIVWVKENTYTFKKLIPTVKKHFDNKELKIITFDDDWIYDKNFIKYMCYLSDKFPDECISPKNVILGAYTLYKPKFFDENLWLLLNDEIIETKLDDHWYKTLLKIKGIKTHSDFNIKNYVFRPKNFNNDPLNEIYKKDGYLDNVEEIYKKYNFI